MPDIKFQILRPEDIDLFQLIADWYFNEWKIPIEKTIQNLKTVTADPSQFQVLMTLDACPISTAGVYHHVGLLDKEPRFKIYRNWLALVYTVPEQRQKGYGALICNYIQNYSKCLGVKQLYLFTDTAEKLYKRLGWEELERVSLGQRSIVVMEKSLE